MSLKYRISGLLFGVLALLCVFFHFEISWQSFFLASLICFIAADYFGSKKL